MVTDKSNMSMAGLYKLLQMLAEELDRDSTLLQVLAFTRIASTGSTGIDHGQLQDELKASSAAMSRTVQLLSSVHYTKAKEGFGLIERSFDPVDNRRRVLRLTPKGEKVAAKFGAVMAKL